MWKHDLQWTYKIQFYYFYDANDYGRSYTNNKLFTAQTYSFSVGIPTYSLFIAVLACSFFLFYGKIIILHVNYLSVLGI